MLVPSARVKALEDQLKTLKNDCVAHQVYGVSGRIDFKKFG